MPEGLICQMYRSSRILSVYFLNAVSLVGECRREYMVGAPKALAGSSPVADPAVGFSKLSSICCRQS